MEEPCVDTEAISPIGCLIALALGPVVAIGTAVAFSLLTGRSLNLSEEWGVFAFQSLLISVPFVAVALTGTQKKAPWIVGLALTVLLWGYYLYNGVSYQWHPDGSGANIGLGLIMLISPIFITASCIGVYLWQRRKTR